MANFEVSVDKELIDQIRRVDIVDYILIIAHHKKLIVRSALIAFLGSVILFWVVLPRWYKSTAVVLPPKQVNPLGLLGQLSKASSSLRSLGLGQSSDDLAQLQTILASRRALEEVIRKFNLQAVYDVDTMEKAVKQLTGNVEVSTGKEDVSIEIVAYDTNPVRSSEIANYLVHVLDKVFREMSVAEAKANREFLERRYRQNLSDLKTAEESYKLFQLKYSVYSVPDQVKAAVEAAAAIQSQVAVKEVQLGILSNSTSLDNPSRQMVQLELQELKKQLNIMKSGSSGKEPKFQIFAPFDKTPEIGMEYFRRYREVEMQGKILELLLPLYEQAKIEEQRDTPSVIVLDTAVPAEKAAKPKRAILTVMITLGSIFFAFLTALVLERSSQSRASLSEQELAKLTVIKRELHWRRIFR